MKRSSSLFTAILFAFSLCGSAAAQSVIFLVRHADRASSAEDSLLSATGEQRASCLARTLADAGIAEVFATEVKRTQQTAEPVSREFHIETKIVAKARTADLVSELKKSDRTRVLVVGHSDTLPDIVQRLGAGSIPKFGDREYDRLIIVPMTRHKAQTPIVLRYCSLASDAGSSAETMH
jgi:broad specificity phosphatase PhoE